MKSTGLIVGKFYPLHQGHINMILNAKEHVDQLHVFVCSDTERDRKLYEVSAFTTEPSAETRVQWATDIFAGLPGVTVHGFNEDGIPAYPNGWEAWSERLIQTLEHKKIIPTVIFSSEPQDKDFYEALFNVNVTLVDPPRTLFPISATQIRQDPIKNWHFIPTIIRPYFTKKVLIDRSLTTKSSVISALCRLFEVVEVENFAKISFEITDLGIYTPSISEPTHISAIIAPQKSLESFLEKHNSHSNKEPVSQKSFATFIYDESSTKPDSTLLNELVTFVNTLLQ